MPSSSTPVLTSPDPLACHVVINIFPVYKSPQSTPSPHLVSPPLLQAVTPAVNQALNDLPMSPVHHMADPDALAQPLDLSMPHMPRLTPVTTSPVLPPPPSNPHLLLPNLSASSVWNYLSDVQPILPPSLPDMMDFMTVPPEDIHDLPVLGADNVSQALPTSQAEQPPEDFPELMDSDQLDNALKSLNTDEVNDCNNNLPTSVDDMFSLLDLPTIP